VLDETARSAEAGEPFKLEYRMLARGGRVVWLHDVASVLTRDSTGRATRYQGVQLDITARKEAEHAQRKSFEQLRLVDRQRRELLARLVMTEQEERRRIADELHDHAVQSLSVALIRLQTIGQDHPEVGGLEGFALASREISKSIARLRHMTFELHPRVLDTDGLEAALRSLIERTTSTPAAPASRLEYRVTKEPTIPVASILYRIAQEALANARAYSGASAVTIRLEEKGGGLLIQIEDDGKGLQVEEMASRGEHVGLPSMRERAEAAGGWCQIESTPGSGTTVQCWVPSLGSLSGEATRVDSPSVPALVSAPTSGGKPSAAPGERPPGDLSPRELEVAELLALGHTNAEVAAILHLSVRTIEHHRSRVFHKLGVQSRAGLVRTLREWSQSSS
jgi:signal transduction histidine kinase/DNA-binding CsgD family transcriptional regulator